jgi:hypothetical protein
LSTEEGVMEKGSIVMLEYGKDSVALASGETVVGRALGCGVRFNEPSVSRRHLLIALEGDRITVEDLGSANGTLVDGQPLVEPRQLRGGEEIAIGQRRIRLVRIESTDDPYADEDTLTEPPQEQERSTTLQGHSVVELPTHRTCPKCRAEVPMEASHCECGFSWPRGRPAAVTQQIPKNLAPDQRAHPRALVSMPLLYSSEELMFDAVARNLSQGGLFIGTTQLDAVGTRCNVTLLPDGGPAVSFSGVVRHRIDVDEGRLPGMGIEFVEKSKADEQWLTDLLARQRGRAD